MLSYPCKKKKRVEELALAVLPTAGFVHRTFSQNRTCHLLIPAALSRLCISSANSSSSSSSSLRRIELPPLGYALVLMKGKTPLAIPELSYYVEPRA